MTTPTPAEKYTFEVSALSSAICFSLLLSLVISIFPLLLSRDNANYGTSVPFYAVVIPLLCCMIYFGFKGALIGLFVFILNGEFHKFDVYKLAIDVAINTAQLIFMYVSTHILYKNADKNKNKYASGVFYVSGFNLLLLFSGITYTVVFIVFPDLTYKTMDILAISILIATIYKSYRKKDAQLILYTLGVSLLPSLVCSFASAKALSVPDNFLWQYIKTWLFSNFILLQTYGYILYQLLFCKTNKGSSVFAQKTITMSFETSFYFIALVLWNIIILTLHFKDVFTPFQYTCFLPWTLGNVLFGANFIFSFEDDSSEKQEKFDWLENRLKVIETNTGTIIRAVAFLIPLAAGLMLNKLPDSLWILFVLNVFCSCMTIGLIWVPSHRLKFLSLLKTVKTIFHLYAVSFLLLSIIVLVAQKFSATS